jgi:nitrite reductase (NADH) large subunit
MARLRIVVVGCGLAGASVVAAVLAKAEPDAVKIDVVSAETQGAYDRFDLPKVLDGSASASDIVRYDPAWFAERGVRLHAGRQARFIDRFRRQVQTDELALPYDKLVLATGGATYLPPILNLLRADGKLHHGAFTFRTLNDCSALGSALSTMRKVAVIGGGPLGIELARALCARGAEVHLFHVGQRLMSGQLDERAARILTGELEALGASMHFGVRALKLLGDGQLRGLSFSDGSELACDAVVLATGCQPDTWLGFQCGLSVERGIAVDGQLRSIDDLSIYALGECAQWRAAIYGSPLQIAEQARVIAEQLTSRYSEQRYLGQRSALQYRVAGVDLLTLGRPESVETDDVAQLCGPGRARYKKIVLRRGRLVSAILLGDLRQATSLSKLYAAAAPLTPDAQHRLFDLCVPLDD